MPYLGYFLPFWAGLAVGFAIMLPQLKQFRYIAADIYGLSKTPIKETRTPEEATFESRQLEVAYLLHS
jgi:hypothetical protein